MSAAPELTLHVLIQSHPCRAAEAALRLKGLEFERVELVPGEHAARIEEIYGAGRTTVPGLLADGEPVHGSRPIMARLEELAPDPPLFPAPIGAEVREAERWGDAEFQPLGRSLSWGALHFRPEAMATFTGGAPLDPAGTDFAIKYLRAAWRYNEISATRIAADLALLPERLRHIDELAERGIVGGEEATAADLQIGATARLLLNVGDLRPVLAGSVAERIARRWFPDYPGDIPAGAFPADWIATRDTPRGVD